MKTAPKGDVLFETGAPGRIRTHDPLVRRNVKDAVNHVLIQSLARLPILQVTVAHNPVESAYLD